MSFWSFLAGAAAGAAVTYVVIEKPYAGRRGFLQPAAKASLGQRIAHRDLALQEAKRDMALGEAGWYALMYELDVSAKGAHLDSYDGPYIHKETAHHAAQAARAEGWDEPGKAKVVVKHLKKRPF